MTEENEPTPDVYAAEVVGDGPETGAIVSITTVKARDLTDEHVGKFIGFHTEDFNYSAKIRRVKQLRSGQGTRRFCLAADVCATGWHTGTRRAHARAF